MRKNHPANKRQAPKVRKSPTQLAATLDLRQGSRTTPVPSGKIYDRHDMSWQREW